MVFGEPILSSYPRDCAAILCVHYSTTSRYTTALSVGPRVTDNFDDVARFRIVGRRRVGSLDLRKVRTLDVVLVQHLLDLLFFEKDVLWNELVLAYVYHVWVGEEVLTRYYRLIRRPI